MPFLPFLLNLPGTGFVPIEQALETYLNANVAGLSLWPLRVPQTITSFPVATWTVSGTDHLYHLDGSAGACVKTFVYELYGFNPLDCLILAESIRLKLMGFKGSLSGVPILSSFLDDETWQYFEPEDGSDDGIFDLTLTFKVKYREAIPPL